MAISYQWTPEEQREYSLARLFEYIKDYIHPYSPYYRRLFKEHEIVPNRLKAYDDLRRIPVTEKKHLLDDPWSFVLQPKTEETAHDVESLSAGKRLTNVWRTLATSYIRDLYGKPRSFAERVKHTTAGEWLPIHINVSDWTGEAPTTALYTDHDLRKVVPYIAGMTYLFGWEPTMRAINLLPALPHLTFFQVVFTELTVDRGSAVFHTCGESAMSTERQIQIAGSMPFDMYIATPSYLTNWLKTATVMIDGGEVERPDPVKYALLAGESLTDEQRDELKEQFAMIGSPDIKIIESYGSTELKAAFFECDEKTNLHLNPEFYFWEVLDSETREPVPWGEPGVLTFSHVGWRGSALIRYWTGDLVQGGVVWDRCPGCGFTMPVMRSPVDGLTAE